MAALDGYSALVTGGGSGIGEGCAAALVRDGAAVTICGRTLAKLDEAADRMRAATSGAVPAGKPTRIRTDCSG
jgi:NADP-dependent 3-hydroxy acid dehydrogenase YdfG